MRYSSTISLSKLTAFYFEVAKLLVVRIIFEVHCTGQDQGEPGRVSMIRSRSRSRVKKVTMRVKATMMRLRSLAVMRVMVTIKVTTMKLRSDDKTTAAAGFQGQTDVEDNSVVLPKHPTAGPNPARSVKTRNYSENKFLMALPLSGAQLTQAI